MIGCPTGYSTDLTSSSTRPVFPSLESAAISGASLSTTPVGPGTGGIDYGFGTGSVSGTANLSAFGVTPSVNITCSYPSGIGTCGITFGRTGFTGVEGHAWVHTFNVSVVALPEPATALLVVFAAAGLLLRSRRA